jgi:1-acyl-sn-glycerol-3-phosphate acyltransferase
MIKARHIPFFVRFFNWYSRRMMKSHFREIRYHDKPAHIKKAVLVISNHFSWWDGFFIVHYNNIFFKKKFHVMMLEDQLSNRLFLNKAGAFSIKKNSRSALKSLQYAGQLLSHSANLLLMFPQGEIQSQHNCNFRFEKGIESILKYSSDAPEILFVANLTEYYSHKKPSLDVYFRIFDKPFESSEQLQHAYNSFFQDCLNRQKPPQS